MIKRFRYWLVRLLLTEDEKYLLEAAIVDRVEKLQRLAITEKWVDTDNTKQDAKDLNSILIT